MQANVQPANSEVAKALESGVFGSNVQFHAEDFPPRDYRPDRLSSITRIISVGEFSPEYDSGEIAEVANRARLFCRALNAQLAREARFDLNYPIFLHVVEGVSGDGLVNAPSRCYRVYAEVDYVRDMGSWLSRLDTRASFSKAYIDAEKEVRESGLPGAKIFRAEIVHVGMTGSEERGGSFR